MRSQTLSGLAVLATALLVACSSGGSSTDADAQADADATVAVDTTVTPDTAEPADTAPADTTPPGDTGTPAVCDDDGDCAWCLYPSAPATVNDCYCAICPSVVLDVPTCTANGAAWTSVCSSWSVSCPVADCLARPDAICSGGQCQDKCALVDCAEPDCPESERVRLPGACCDTCRDPAACAQTADCGWCAFDKPVASEADCYCKGCPTTPLGTAVCSEFAAQYADHCPEGWDAAAPCAQPRCIVPPPVACDPATSTCVNGCDLVDCAPLDCPVAEQIREPGSCCATCPPDPGTCQDGGDCTRCTYSHAVESVSDCYCTLCPSHPATQAECALWGDQWQTTCGGTWASENPCPVAICLSPEPVGCQDGTCASCDQVTCPVLDCPASRRFKAEGDCCEQCAPEPAPCSDAETCGWCPYSRGVSSPSECYCTICPSFAVTQIQCATWGTEWQTHCGGTWADENPCPVAICLGSSPLTCDPAGACVVDPTSCNSARDCGTCQYATAPKSSAECQCPGCPVATTTAQCAANMEAVDTYCSNGELDECLPPPCAVPPPVECSSGHECVFGSGAEPR